MTRAKYACFACAIAVSTASLCFPGLALAQSPEEMKKQIDELQRQIQQLKDRLDQMAAKQQAPAPAPVAAGGRSNFIERKEGDGITFYTRGGEVSVYGVLDVSIDSASKGIGSVSLDGASPPAGKTGWMPDISSNLSYVGVRGFQTLGNSSTNFVYQLETQVDVSATPGTANSNSNTSDTVKGALVSRNSFIGFASRDWGPSRSARPTRRTSCPPGG